MSPLRHVRGDTSRVVGQLLASCPEVDRATDPATRSEPDRRPGQEAGRRRRALLQTIKGARFNSWSEVEVEVLNGFAVVPPNLSVMAIVHRHGRNDPKPQLAIIEGWDRWRGAFAQLSGHSHGGQVRLPGIGPLFLPAGGQRYPIGFYSPGGMPLYTSRGAGVFLPPVRINCPPEVTLVTLVAR